MLKQGYIAWHKKRISFVNAGPRYPLLDGMMGFLAFKRCFQIESRLIIHVHAIRETFFNFFFSFFNFDNCCGHSQTIRGASMRLGCL